MITCYSTAMNNNNILTNDETRERVILVGLDTGDFEEADNSLDELAELAETAGAEEVFSVLQSRGQPHPATYVGSGKVEELKGLIQDTEATGIICDDELTPSQMQHLSDLLGVKIMDRTMLILDIFAQRAVSREGKLQVELAQLRYTASHLAGMRKYLSRQGGGIGTRGPGEKKIEVDRRLISKRITSLKAEISEMEKNRSLQRKKRASSEIPTGAIVGYTNAGKSTLLNRLTDAEVLEANKLFATLDPTTRTFILPGGQQILLTDTVGFVRKLPHNLIDAFRSTLEEAKYADFLIHVVDADDPQMLKQMEITYRTLEDLGAADKPIITILNKMDLVPDPDALPSDPKAAATIKTSIPLLNNTDLITSAIEKILHADKVYVERLYSYSDAGKIQQIRKYGRIVSEKYTENGIYVEAYIPSRFL